MIVVHSLAILYFVGVVVYAVLVGIPRLARDFQEVRDNWENDSFWDDLDEPLLAWEFLWD